MTQSLYLRTARLEIVGINDINFHQVVHYYLENYHHLIQGGGFPPKDESQIRKLFNQWHASIEQEEEIRFFVLYQKQLIGIISVTQIVRGAFQAAYLGYHLAENKQGEGYMTEALQEAIAFCFSALNLHRLMANYRPDNIASERVLEKLNFVREGYAKDYLLVNGEWRDHVLTSLTNSHWHNLRD